MGNAFKYYVALTINGMVFSRVTVVQLYYRSLCTCHGSCFGVLRSFDYQWKGDYVGVVTLSFVMVMEPGRPGGFCAGQAKPAGKASGY
jgi:hypothetical protein